MGNDLQLHDHGNRYDDSVVFRKANLSSIRTVRGYQCTLHIRNADHLIKLYFCRSKCGISRNFSGIKFRWRILADFCMQTGAVYSSGCILVFLSAGDGSCKNLESMGKLSDCRTGNHVHRNIFIDAGA